MASLKPWDSSVVNSVIIHLNIGLNILVMDSSLMLCHQRIIVLSLKSRLFHLHVELLVVDLHSLFCFFLLQSVLLFRI